MLDSTVRHKVNHVGQCWCIGTGELRVAGSGGGEGMNGMGGEQVTIGSAWPCFHNKGTQPIDCLWNLGL